MIVVATLALVAVVALALVGMDRRDVVTLGTALLLEDVIMLGNAVVLVALCIAVGIVWWRGRMERERVARVAREVEARRRAQADAAAVDAIAAAQAKAERDRSRPALDVLNEKMRRGGIFVLVLSMLSPPARALDCSTLPPITLTAPLTQDQAECLRLRIVTTEFAAETCEAQLVASRVAVDACEATAAITCPPPTLPVVPVVVASLVGLVVGVVATVALVLR